MEQDKQNDERIKKNNERIQEIQKKQIRELKNKCQNAHQTIDEMQDKMTDMDEKMDEMNKEILMMNKQLKQQQNVLVQTISSFIDVPAKNINVVIKPPNIMNSLKALKYNKKDYDIDIVSKDNYNHNHNQNGNNGTIAAKYPFNDEHQPFKKNPFDMGQINLDAELIFDGPICGNPDHYKNKTKVHSWDNKQVTGYNPDKGCTCATHKTKIASAIIIGLFPNIIAVSCAHNFPNDAKNYKLRINLFGIQIIQFPMHKFQIHPNYDFVIDAKFDIGIMVASTISLPIEIKTELQKNKIKPFKIIMGKNDGNECVLNGYTHFLTEKAETELRSSNIKFIESNNEDIEYNGGCLGGQSGGGIVQYIPHSNDMKLVAIQSLGIKNKTKIGEEDDYHSGVGCKLTANKLAFLKKYSPNHFVSYETENGECVTFFDSV